MKYFISKIEFKFLMYIISCSTMPIMSKGPSSRDGERDIFCYSPVCNTLSLSREISHETHKKGKIVLFN